MRKNAIHAKWPHNTHWHLHRADEILDIALVGFGGKNGFSTAKEITSGIPGLERLPTAGDGSGIRPCPRRESRGAWIGARAEATHNFFAALRSGKQTLKVLA